MRDSCGRRCQQDGATTAAEDDESAWESASEEDDESGDMAVSAEGEGDDGTVARENAPDGAEAGPDTAGASSLPHIGWCWLQRGNVSCRPLFGCYVVMPVAWICSFLEPPVQQC